MGQYHLIVNTTKREFLDPHQFGDGMKFGDFAYGSDGVMSALALLIANSIDEVNDVNGVLGSWAGDQIVISGDYAEPWANVPEDIQKEILDGRHPSTSLYELCHSAEEDTDEGSLKYEAMFEDASERILEVMCGFEHLGERLARNEFFWMIHDGRAKDKGKELPEFLQKLRERFVIEKLS